MREDDQAVFADAGYISDEYKCGARYLGMRWCVNDKRKPNKSLSSKQKKRNRKQSSVRARVEPIFRITKCQFGFCKTRYRGLATPRRSTCWPSQPVPAQEAIDVHLGEIRPKRAENLTSRLKRHVKPCAVFINAKVVGQSGVQ